MAKSKIDWNNVLYGVGHIALLAGAAALQVYAPAAAPIWAPVIQAVGQALPAPATEFRKPAE